MTPQKNMIKSFARKLFARSLCSYMAKTVHAFEIMAYKELNLAVQIRICAESEHSYPYPSHISKKRPGTIFICRRLDENKRLTSIVATIIIHKEAVDELIKSIILHELWHLEEEIIAIKNIRKSGGTYQEVNIADKMREHRCDTFMRSMIFLIEQLYEGQLKTKYKSFAKKIPSDIHSMTAFWEENSKNMFIKGRDFSKPISLAKLKCDGLQDI